MDQIFAKIKVKNSFERSLVDQYNSDLQNIIQGNKNIDDFVQFSTFHVDFIKKISIHYNKEFESDNFEQFDKYATTFCLQNLKQTAYLFQKQYDEYSAFSNEQFDENCKKRQQLTQEQLNIKQQIIFKESFLTKPYEKTINLLKKLPTQSSLMEMRQILIQAIQFIYSDIAEISEYTVTGDDIADIMVFILIKAKPLNFASTLYALQNNLPQKMLEGETGYYLMALNIAITFICTMSEDFIKTDQLVKDSDYLNQQIFVLPYPKLYTEIIGQYFVTLSQFELQNFKCFFCYEYIFDEKQIFKTINVKSEGDTCPAITVKFQPNISCSQANLIYNQLCGLRHPSYYTEQIQEGRLICIKNTQLISSLNQQILISDAFCFETLEQLKITYKLGLLSCIQYENLQSVFKSDQQLMLTNMQSIAYVDEQLVQTVSNSYQINISQANEQLFLLNYKQPENNIVQLVGFIYQFFGLGTEDIPDNVSDIFQYFQNEGLQNFASKVKNTIKFKEFFKFVPDNSVQNFVFNRFSDYSFKLLFNFTNMELNEYFDALLTKNEIYSVNQLPNVEFITPFLFRAVSNFLRFLFMVFMKITGIQITYLSSSGYWVFVQHLKSFQQENNLIVNGYFDSLTIERLMELLLADFCTKKFKQQKYESDIFFCLS